VRYSQLCVTLHRMPIKKATKTHTSSRKKASMSSTLKGRGKKAPAKASKRTAEESLEPNISEAEWLKLRKRTLKMFQMVYDDYQNGKFHRIL
jgi:hypothetical protein